MFTYFESNVQKVQDMLSVVTSAIKRSIDITVWKSYSFATRERETSSFFQPGF